MPAKLTPIPPALRGRIFSLRDARIHGLGPRTLEHSRFDTPFHGMRLLRTPEVVARNVTPPGLLPPLRKGESYSHTTALLLLGCPIRCDTTPHLTVVAPQHRRELQGVAGHTVATPYTPQFTERGFRIVPPTLAILQAAAILPFKELVVAIDHLVHSPRKGTAVTSIDDLEKLSSVHASRGIRRLRVALKFARVGSESRMETLLRLLLAAHGLDALDLQVTVRGADGAWIGRFDMVDPERKSIIEYDGEQHRTNNFQYEKDQDRIDRARDAGYRILRIRRKQLIDEPARTARRAGEFLGLPLRPVTGQLAAYFAE